MEKFNVTNNESLKRFEHRMNDQIAYINYKIMKGKIILVSTHVPPIFAGQGVGSKLVDKAIEQVEKMDLEIVPVCSFTQKWFLKNPEKQHLLALKVDAEKI